MVPRKSVRKYIEDLQKYADYSIEDVMNYCILNLKELRELPEENKHFIKYYEKMWMELSTYF